jgi:hypothetical protein
MQSLTRDQAIAQCGLEAVNRVESANPDFSRREIDGLIEFTASVPCCDQTLTAYYYQTRRDVDAVENLDDLIWSIAHYSVA